MELIEGSETSAIRTQTSGNYLKENILHIEHGESLKSRISMSPSHTQWCLFDTLSLNKQRFIHLKFNTTGTKVRHLIRFRIFQQIPNISLKITNFNMQGTSWRIDNYSADQEIRRMLGKKNSSKYLQCSEIQPRSEFHPHTHTHTHTHNQTLNCLEAF